MGIERPVGAYPTVETEKRLVEELFQTFERQDLVVVGSFIPRITCSYSGVSCTLSSLTALTQDGTRLSVG